jgi:transposase
MSIRQMPALSVHSVDALKEELFAQSMLHAAETSVAILKPDNGKTHRACL